MNKLLKFIAIIMISILIICQYTIVSNAAETDTTGSGTTTGTGTTGSATGTDAETSGNSDTTMPSNTNTSTQTGETEEEPKTIINLKSQTKKLSVKDEIKVYLYIDTLELEDGIMYVRGKLEYDDKILEPIVTNGSTYNDWTIAYNEDTDEFSFDRMNAVTEGEIAEIIFKVKEELPEDVANKTSIKFTNVEVANLDDEVKAKDVELEFSVTTSNNEENSDEDGKKTTDDGKKDSSEDKKGNSGNNGNDTKDKETKQDEKSGQTDEPVDTTQKDGDIPYTGKVEWTILLIVAVSIVGFISYKKYRKYKNV